MRPRYVAGAGKDVPLFPSALPYPEALYAKGHLVVESLDAVCWAKIYLNELVAWSNFLCLGCPDYGGAAYEPRVGYRSTSEARVFADGLLGEVVEFANEELRRGTLGFTGKRQVLDELLNKLACKDAYGGPLAPLKEDHTTVALPVVADRIAVPKHAGTVGPLDLLPAERAQVVANMEDLKLPEALWREVVTACHKVPKTEEAGLMKRLLETNMVTLIPEADIPKDDSGKLLVGGLFSVPKNDEEDRLIFDRRPQNATMQKLTWAHLPAGACFSRMTLEDSEFLRGSGDDLRNYYYALKLPSNWIKYNAVG